MFGFIYEFICASILMGLAIGIDAAIATSVNTPAIREPRKALLWLGGVSFTHTVFPMVGYLMSYYGLQEYPGFTPLIGLTAFYLIAHYVFNEYKHIGTQCDDASDYKLSYWASLGLIIAVSWDALWSGPAKSAQVIEWPTIAVWSSFLIVGATVTILSTFAFYLAIRFNNSKTSRTPSARRTLAQWLQLSAVSYFGWQALSRYTFDLHISSYLILIFALASTALMLWLHLKPLKSRTSQNKPTLGALDY